MKDTPQQSAHIRSICLIFIMVGITMLVLGTTITALYQTAFEEERARLINTAQSRARLIEAMANHSMEAHRTDPMQDTLLQIRDAHRHFAGFGNTGEFTLARLEDNQIVFLMSHRHHDLGNPHNLPFAGEDAEPMRLALKGESGSLVGRDYRGENVLAAYEPVAGLNLGVVAKIDMSEIRAPFMRTALEVFAFAMLLVLLGAAAFKRITARTARHMEESEKLFRETFSHAAIGLAHVGLDGSWMRVNQKICDIAGYTREELLQLTFQDISHPDDLDTDLGLLKKTLAGEIDTYTLKKRYIRKDQTTVTVQLTVSLVRDRNGKPDYFISAIDDITALEHAMSAIKTISGIVPLCAWCGKTIRNEKGDWVRLEEYFEDHTDAEISHGMCPKCMGEFSGAATKPR